MCAERPGGHLGSRVHTVYKLVHKPPLAFREFGKQQVGHRDIVGIQRILHYITVSTAFKLDIVGCLYSGPVVRQRFFTTLYIKGLGVAEQSVPAGTVAVCRKSDPLLVGDKHLL